ncbi:PREDICTED: olfactory receptor 4Q3-like [Elephantulus edwardii]|uniref:olfactory receptor 4Q3-like n=1 Tax=Elephantulus edwardii TaxID=28737 RepID=UPI0003F0E208|nr:PREDICTED: olfactory receptor 4Q3-like [Elephantulus edwardii]
MGIIARINVKYRIDASWPMMMYGCFTGCPPIRSAGILGWKRGNDSNVSEFVLLGLSSSWELQLFLFLLFVMFYMAIVLGNLLIVVTVQADAYLLQSPMYYFLGHLSFIDLCLSCVTVPKMLGDFLSQGKTISFSGCVTQIYFLHFLGASEMFLLTVMAYDRYVAICNPLHYLTVMNRQLCHQLVFACWCGGFIHSITQVILVIQLPFCGPNELDNFYCDVPQVIKLACMDTYVVEVLMVSNSGLLSLVCFLILLCSYAVILMTLRTRFRQGQSKALSTCASHLTVVSLIFVPCVFIYLRPFCSFSVDKIFSVFYTVITPMLNPLIYTLRNADMKKAMQKLRKKHVTFCCHNEE